MLVQEMSKANLSYKMVYWYQLKFYNSPIILMKKNVPCDINNKPLDTTFLPKNKQNEFITAEYKPAQKLGGGAGVVIAVIVFLCICFCLFAFVIS